MGKYKGGGGGKESEIYLFQGTCILDMLNMMFNYGKCLGL